MKHIGDLKPDEANARLHNPRNIGMIVDALHEVGAARSIVIDENDMILAGHGVIEAAAEAGIENVRVVEATGGEIIAVRRTGLTTEQKRRLAYFDNRTAELADWHPGQIAADIEAGLNLNGLFYENELTEILAGLEIEKPQAPEPQIDRAEELREKWQTERDQIWQVGKHRLMCGDSTNAEDVEWLMESEKAILMVTDPPYGVSYDASWRNRAAEAGFLAYAASRVGPVTNDEPRDWAETWALFTGDIVYCWHAAVNGCLIVKGLTHAGFEIRAQIIWAKSNFPVSRGHYHWRHEPCWYAVRKGSTAHWIGDRKQSTLWEINLDRNVEGGHSTQKPLECMARPIRNHEGDVYDPFLSSGTTMVAAEQLSRMCYGMEISPAYVAVALERMAAMGLKPQLALR